MGRRHNQHLDHILTQVLTWITEGPTGCGLDRTNWTYDALATFLYQTIGIAVSEMTIRTFCSQRSIARPGHTAQERLGYNLQDKAVSGTVVTGCFQSYIIKILVGTPLPQQAVHRP